MRLPRTGIFLAMLAAALILFLPLRLALGWLALDGLSARAVSGSIWMGRLRDARFRGVPLGDIDMGLGVMPLLLGQARFALRGEKDGERRIDGAVSIGWRGPAIRGLSAHLGAGGAFAPLPISSLDLADVDLRFRSGRCLEAGGLVKAGTGGDMAGIALPGGLSGTIRCEAGDLLLPLVSQSGTEQVVLRLRGDGRYTGELIVRPTNAETRGGLIAAGFIPGAEGYRLAVEGRL